jgi:hypothetical protein
LSASHNVDPQRLAALLDGRLSATEAVELRAQLGATDNETLAAYADAVAVASELGFGATATEGAQSDVVPITLALRKRRWAIGAMTAAAAAAAIVFLVVRADRMGESYAPAVYARAIPAGASVSETNLWNVMRGGGGAASDGIADAARAVRVGSLLTDLQIGALRGSSIRTPATDLATLIEGVPGGGAVAVTLRDLTSTSDSVVGMAAAPNPSRARVAEAGRFALALVDRRLANAGAYLEAARIALDGGDPGFFDRAPPTPLAELDSDPLLEASRRDAVRNLIALSHARPADPHALRAAVTGLLRTLAN